MTATIEKDKTTTCLQVMLRGGGEGGGWLVGCSGWPVRLKVSVRGLG